jgi:hypothetical protein
MKYKCKIHIPENIFPGKLLNQGLQIEFLKVLLILVKIADDLKGRKVHSDMLKNTAFIEH